MYELLARLVQVQEDQRQQAAQRSDREMDLKLKLERRLQPVTAENDSVYLDEIEAFELQLKKAGVSTWASWYKYFEEAVCGRAQVWTRELKNYGEGYRLHHAAHIINTEDDWRTVYLFMRRELMKRVGVQ